MKILFQFVLHYFLCLTPSTNRITGFDIPDLVYEFCPFSDICNKSATVSLDENGLVPCCGSCACDDQCGLRLDCCFEELDKYKLIENQIVGCIAPVIGNAEPVDSETSYYMVKTCNGLSSGHSDKTLCKMTDDSGHSLVAPVSSLKTRNIYVNEECARCNDLQEFKKWDYLYFSVTKSPGFFNTDTVKNVRNNKGMISFVPPSDEDWTRKECRKQVLYSCLESSGIQEACENLNLPFNSGKRSMYRNVLCYICYLSTKSTFTNISTFTSYVEIISKCLLKPRYFFSNMMQLLIHQSMLDFASLVTKDRADMTETNGCLHLNDTCLQIHCPLGMLMTNIGCKYYIERWFSTSIVIKIKLLPAHGTKLLHKEIDSLVDKDVNTAWINSHCRIIKPTDVYVDISPTKNAYVGSFIVSVWIDTVDGFKPEVTINIIRKCFDNPWSITVNNVTYIFKAALDKYTNVKYHHSNISLYDYNNMQEYLDDVSTLGSDIYRQIFQDTQNIKQMTKKGHLIIKKTFFCHQVYLEENHVTKMVGSIFIPSKNITLGDNEYSMNTNDEGWSTYSVCVGDLDPLYVNGLTDNRYRLHSHAVVASVFYLLLL